MAFTALERLLVTERVHQRAARQGGFSVPALGERAVAPSAGPFLVTNMRGEFRATTPSREGVIRYGFSPVPVGADDALLGALYRAVEHRFASVREAMHQIEVCGMEPQSIVVSPLLLAEILGHAPIPMDDVREAARKQGEVATFHGVTVFLADLPGRAGLVAAAPGLVGSYVRTGDYLGVVIERADQSIAVVS